MIKSGEIQKAANSKGVRDTQIEKDYVIDWLLLGISKNKLIVDNLAFKGGTVLKKVYFPDYRFSEDLDFTLLQEEIGDESIFHEFENIFKFIYNESRLQFSIKKKHIHSTGSLNFYISYIAPLGGSKKDLKIDITRKEYLCFDIKTRPIISNYSDLQEMAIKINCYSLSEVLIEKMTALMGRTIPRDLYDLWYLLNIEGLEITEHLQEFMIKSKNKGHNPKELLNKITGKEKIFKLQWKNNLIHQIKDLPDFELVWRGLWKHFRKIAF